ncbi:protein of unknown function [Cupriavidus taiwanensis]|uniref:Uncharacterized protein n=1 Tax=Cupriavidus taiwanensis TaxID=164546 RepID=A0A375IBY6_9BURK|nr:hypothetical protein CBM2592_A170174 [Cupriavidus taiwanensis]SOY82715.1 hypothetical protein CBM2591_A210059 [Cupriavidus taiwanensis]SPA13291.1 hypothetical protein CBM2631_A190060 [Cupriavidus taiwanensis]SPA44909.1 hypothetical protein CBM2629_A170136 [Cupriavidus taiwanensis]SPK71588.1 protein of unknown function [Cupriavidus taiwanensis]
MGLMAACAARRPDRICSRSAPLSSRYCCTNSGRGGRCARPLASATSAGGATAWPLWWFRGGTGVCGALWCAGGLGGFGTTGMSFPCVVANGHCFTAYSPRPRCACRARRSPQCAPVLSGAHRSEPNLKDRPIRPIAQLPPRTDAKSPAAPRAKRSGQGELVRRLLHPNELESVSFLGRQMPRSSFIISPSAAPKGRVPQRGVAPGPMPLAQSSFRDPCPRLC